MVKDLDTAIKVGVVVEVGEKPNCLFGQVDRFLGMRFIFLDADSAM